jgi:Ser/Thr protein kinase RdoA (MazF antagonist)
MRRAKRERPSSMSIQPVFSYRDALDFFGVKASSATKVQSGRNAHWIVRTDKDSVVLRLYHKDCTSSEVAYEHAILRHLKAVGWPVTVPIAEVFPSPVGLWGLFSYVPGRQRAPRTPRGRYLEARSRGRLLAKLHNDLFALIGMGQRERWQSTPRGLFDRRGKLPAETVLAGFAERDPEQGALLLAHHERAQSILKELAVSEAPLTVVHGDFTPWNMRYRRGVLVGLFDFDSAHLDLRVADFALSWRGSYQGVIDGYEDETPLSALERSLIVPVFWAFMVTCAVAGIEQGWGQDWAIKQLSKQPLTSFAP